VKTCVEVRGAISVAHRVPGTAYASIHGHDYQIVAAICVNGFSDMVGDADKLTAKLREVLMELEGKYLSSSSEDTPPFAHVKIPCNAPGLTGECLAKYIADRIGATWVRVCESAGPCFFYSKE